MKKVLSMMLAAALAAGMGVTAFAADYRPGAQIESLGYGYSGEQNLGTFSPDAAKVVEIPIVYGLFEAEPPEGRSLSDKLTEADMRTSSLKVRTNAAKGGDALKEAVIDNRNGVVRVSFAQTMAGTDPLAFEITVYLTVSDKRYDKLGLTFTGTLQNDVTYIYSDDEYIDLSRGKVIEAAETVDKIEVYLGAGVSIYTGLTKGKQYYGSATRDPDQNDDKIFDQHADIAEAVTLRTSGLKVSGDVVKLDCDKDYYAYDGDLAYLGRTSEMLPYSNKYYLAVEKLASASSSGDSSSQSSDNEPSDSSSQPGDTSAPPASSAPDYSGGWTDDGNPDTGDNSYGTAALMAAILSVVVIGALVRKKSARK